MIFPAENLKRFFLLLFFGGGFGGFFLCCFGARVISVGGEADGSEQLQCGVSRKLLVP